MAVYIESSKNNGQMGVAVKISLLQIGERRIAVDGN
jgi:hypothetical protein